MPPASRGLLGRIQRATDDAAHRFGPHTAEVEAFILAASRLNATRWRQVLAARRRVGSISKEGPPDSARSIQDAIKTSDTRISEPMARAGEVLFDALATKTQDKQITAWQAMTALVMRSQLPALKFAVHYAPFATEIPLVGAEEVDEKTRRFMARLKAMGPEGLALLGRRWRIEPAASRALLQAVAKRRGARGEEAVALIAMTVIPNHLAADTGWSAVRTAVHGGRVLGATGDLDAAVVAELWAPLEAAIPLASLDADAEAVQPAAAEVTPARGRPPLTSSAAYGPNHSEVAAFIRGVAELTPIQWLRVLDRRKLVSSITREDAAEPASVVRAILAMLDGTRDLDAQVRGRAFVAVERAGFVLESRGHVSPDQIRQVLAPFEPSISPDGLNGGGFANRVSSLDRSDWVRVASAAPATGEESVAALVNAGTALIDFFGVRTDDEAVAVWHAVSALVHRQHLTPIKFAASYAPFASAIPATRPRSLGALVSRYVTAVGRLGASQCAVLAREWRLDDTLSSVLAGAAADGSARAGEEAAALAAMVTVPMRLTGAGGWAAVKTAALGGRVIAVRTRLSAEQLTGLWAPLQAAIPLASLNAPARARR